MIYRKATAAAILGVFGLVAAIPLAHRAGPDAVLANGFGKVLADADTSWASMPRNVWLSGLGGIPPGNDKVLAPGDTITIAAKDGRPQVIEVTGLELIDGERIGVPGVRFQLVTGRATDSPATTPVRFLFATDAATPAPATAQADRLL